MTKYSASNPSEFIVMLLNSVTVLHVHHLNVTGGGSFAKHMALGDLYEAIEDHVDSIAEAYIGLHNKPMNPASCQCPISESPVDDVKMILDFVQSNRDVMGKESFMQNLIDELEGSIASALYKLRRLE